MPDVQEVALTEPTNASPVPIELGTCQGCDNKIWPADINWLDYREYYLTHHVRSGGIWLLTTIIVDDEPQMYHEACTVVCYQCEERKTRRYACDINRELYCKECSDVWFEYIGDDHVDCTGCGTTVATNDSVYSDWLDDDVCSYCNESRYFDCNDCGYEDYLVNMPDHDCDNNSEEPGAQYIHSYGFKPRPVFWPNLEHKYYLGLELEVEQRHGDEDDYEQGAELIYNALGNRGYLKHDGSLRYGFEIVTHPHTLKEMQDNFPWNALKQLKDYNFRSWNTSTCGIHVHVSRTAFKVAQNLSRTEAHQIRFMKLIYDNQRMVERLAGRSSNYAKFDDKGKIVPKVKLGNQTAGRYSAVNTENDSTLEVRVFRGSLRKERVLSALEFVTAAVEYTRDMMIVPKNKPLSWLRFASYVSENSETYPNLFLIMNELYEKETSNEGDQN